MGTKISFIFFTSIACMFMAMIVHSGAASLESLNPFVLMLKDGIGGYFVYMLTLSLGYLAGRYMTKYRQELQHALRTDGADVLVLWSISVLLGFSSYNLFHSIEITAWLHLIFAAAGTVGSHWWLRDEQKRIALS